MTDSSHPTQESRNLVYRTTRGNVETEIYIYRGTGVLGWLGLSWRWLIISSQIDWQSNPEHVFVKPRWGWRMSEHRARQDVVDFVYEVEAEIVEAMQCAGVYVPVVPPEEPVGGRGRELIDTVFGRSGIRTLHG